MLPAKVVKVDRATGRVSVQPMIQMGDTGGNKITRAIVPNIPIMTMGRRRYFCIIPRKVGDLGFVFAADRDTSLFYQSQGGMDWPLSDHQFGDGGFCRSSCLILALRVACYQMGLVYRQMTAARL